MRRQTPSPDHAAAVSRRLATLGAELDLVRGEHASEPDAEDRPDPPVVPVPGRHASRRPGPAGGPAGSAVGGAVGDVAARLPITATHLAVLAVVVAVALAASAWVVLGRQASPEPLAPVAPVASAAGEEASTPATTPAPTPAAGAVTPGTAPVSGVPQTGDVTVDVAGKVHEPGIVVLPAGSRVVDAIEAAGGARPRVDLSSLNLARLLVDAEQILVGVAAPAPASSTAAAGSAPAGGALVNLNTADAAALDTLPGVGPVTAEAILSWRTEHGGFTAVDELLEVDGIGEVTLSEIAPHVTV